MCLCIVFQTESGSDVRKNVFWPIKLWSQAVSDACPLSERRNSIIPFVRSFIFPNSSHKQSKPRKPHASQKNALYLLEETEFVDPNPEINRAFLGTQIVNFLSPSRNFTARKDHTNSKQLFVVVEESALKIPRMAVSALRAWFFARKHVRVGANFKSAAEYSFLEGNLEQKERQCCFSPNVVKCYFWKHASVLWN